MIMVVGNTYNGPLLLRGKDILVMAGRDNFDACNGRSKGGS